MQKRRTARVVLLDRDNRILLMKGRSRSKAAAKGVWFTIGGGLEPGEDVHAAAAREIVEETGLSDVRLGEAVWRGEAIIHDAEGAPVHFIETFLVAFTDSDAALQDRWGDGEWAMVEALRWWDLEALRRTDETVYPEGLAELLEDLIAGRRPDQPLLIRTVDGPIRPIPRLP